MDTSKKKKVIAKIEEMGVTGPQHTAFAIGAYHVNAIGDDRRGIVPVPESDLPVELPKDVTFDKPDPLICITWQPSVSDMWRESAITKPIRLILSLKALGIMRYCDPRNENAPYAKDKADYWCPVIQYVGGRTCGHALCMGFSICKRVVDR